jgi:hypothetical protein
MRFHKTTTQWNYYCISVVMDRAITKWRITRQDKTKYDNTGELKVLLIHQLVLVCWRAVP